MPAALQCVLFVGICVLAAVVGLFVVRQLDPRALIEQNGQVTATTMQTLGTSYAVLTAFIMVVVWGDFQDAGRNSVGEAVAVASVYRLAATFPDPEAGRIEEALARYARAVVEEEWPLMARGQESTVADYLLDQTWEIFDEMPQEVRETGGYNRALDQLAQAETQRELRLLNSRSGLPGIMWVVLITGAVLTVGCVYFLGVATVRLHALMAGTLAGMIGLTLFMIASLDQSFGGLLSVGPDGFELVLKEVIERQPE